MFGPVTCQAVRRGRQNDMENSEQAQRQDLVEPEGVNAGSNQDLTDVPEGDVLSGGHPDDAPERTAVAPSGADGSTAPLPRP